MAALKGHIVALMSAAENSGNRAQRGKPRGRPFPKGRSGNPGGRPTGYGAFRDLCRDHTSAALATLLGALEAKDATAVAAARVLLAYGWGAPPSAPEDLESSCRTDSELVLSQLSREELLFIAALPDPPHES
jgi:hypothetical protein